MSDDIVLNLAELSRLENDQQKRRDALNAEASKAAALRNERNEEVAMLIESAKQHQQSRDECNKKVSELKEKKVHLEKSIEKVKNELQALEQEPEDNTNLPRIRTPIHVLRREIKALEWKIQTSVLPIKQEKQLVERVADLSEKFEIAKKSLGRKEKTRRLERDLQRLQSKLRQLHGRIRRTVKESQKHHTAMIDIWKQVDSKKKEADQAHQTFLGIKEQADLEHRKLLEIREEIRNLKASIYTTRRRKEQEKQRYIKEQLEAKTKIAYDKFKEGGKLSMEEFTILVEKGLI
ncbi:MAG: coiled-coil protein [Candidatus Ranarchaeia archaeon]